MDRVGEGVTEFAEGDRVAYAGVPPGAYAEVRCLPAHRLVRLPDGISSRDAAGMMLQGMTARYLLKGCFPVRAGTTLLIHAASGGVGSLLCQWARYLGATTIGTVGSREKAEIARANGCTHTILYRDEDFETRVREITGGRGVDVVYDSVGKTTFAKSLGCLRPMGVMVSFGQSSGPVPPLDLGVLAAKGSLFLTRPSLMHYTARRDDLLAHAQDLFDVMSCRGGEGEHRPGVCPARCRHRPPGPRGERDHRQLDPAALILPARACCRAGRANGTTRKRKGGRPGAARLPARQSLPRSRHLRLRQVVEDNFLEWKGNSIYTQGERV